MLRERLGEECLGRHGPTVLEALVNHRIIEQACQQQGVTVTPQDVAGEIEAMARRFSVPRDKWRVKKDGGRFDQMSGATISARAVTNASGRALAWAMENRERLFALPPNARFEQKEKP